MEFEFGTFNESADKVQRIDDTWSDTNLDRDYNDTDTFDRLKCNSCGCVQFEVLNTGDYETSAKCVKCNKYFIVHTG